MMRYPVTAAIVDYELGNLFSVKQACCQVGMNAVITSDKRLIQKADVVVLPGVGAFGNAMASLKKLDMITFLQDMAMSGRPFIGICLGFQLLMSVSYEFGSYRGLNIISGEVVRFDFGCHRKCKIPHTGWNRIQLQQTGHVSAQPAQSLWALHNLQGGEYMYFVHSYHVVPHSQSIVATTTTYGDITFCSSIQQDAVFACQFHPERSGPGGLLIYRNIAARAIAARET